jgi:hypothetical protein
MPLTWRPATWSDVEQALEIQPKFWGDALVGRNAAIQVWKHLVRDPFFASALLESSPAIQGHRLIGLGASVLVSTAFGDREIASPCPDMNSRIIASIYSGQSVVASRSEVAQANAGDGIDLAVMGGFWRDEILSSNERQEVQTLLAFSFTEWHAGYRIRNIFHETVDEAAKQFAQHSIVYQPIAEFPQLGRVIHLMTPASVRSVPASLGNLLFSFREPVLRLRDSDQQLLRAALRGATDRELAAELGVKLSAVKARWRSIFARIERVMPSLVGDTDERDGRGTQKRHRVSAYVRSHPEELRPYDWKRRSELNSSGMATTA